MQTETESKGITPISVFPKAKTERYLPTVVLEPNDVVALTDTHAYLLRGEIRIGMEIIPYLRLDELQPRPEKPASICPLGHDSEKGERCYEDLYVIAEARLNDDKSIEAIVQQVENELFELGFLISKYEGHHPKNWQLSFRIKRQHSSQESN